MKIRVYTTRENKLHVKKNFTSKFICDTSLLSLITSVGGGALSTETPSTTKTALISFTCSLAYQQIKFAPPPPFPPMHALFPAHTHMSRPFPAKTKAEISLYIHLWDNLKFAIYKVRPQSLWGRRWSLSCTPGANFCPHVDLRSLATMLWEEKLKSASLFG